MSAPRFSIVTPVYDTSQKHLEQCIASVIDQTFTDWELCLVDDKSPKARTRRTLTRAAELDPRIRLKLREENGGIVSASNDGLDMARGEFVVLLDHDDALEPDALELIDEMIQRDPLIDYVYSDETMMTESGVITDRFYKPDWSPERFRHQMYVCHLSAIRRSLVVDLGAFRTGFDGAQDYDLMFRVTEAARKIGHVRHLLYHWRMAKTSVANNAAAKPYAYKAGQRAIEAHLDRCRIQASVRQIEDVPGNYRLVRDNFSGMTVRVVIPHTNLTSDIWGESRDHRLVTPALLEANPGMTMDLCHLEPTSNLAREFNVVGNRSEADYLVFCSPLLEPISEGWAAQLIQPLGDPGIGIVSGITYTANSRLEHAGYFLEGSFVRHAYFRLGLDDRGQRAVLETVYEVSAVDWQCMAVKKALFDELGGFDESLGHPWASIDLCLRAGGLGPHTVVNPWAKFFEFSGSDDFAPNRFRAPKSFRTKWAECFAHDPYRPAQPLTLSIEAARPRWQPKRLNQVSKEKDRTRRVN